MAGSTAAAAIVGGSLYGGYTASNKGPSLRYFATVMKKNKISSFLKNNPSIYIELKFLINIVSKININNNNDEDLSKSSDPNLDFGSMKIRKQIQRNLNIIIAKFSF